MTAAPAFARTVLDGTLPARFDAVAASAPDRLAVADDTRRLDYAAVARLAGALAGALHDALPASPPQPVGILLEHEARFPAAMLGVLMAGHIYVPLDAAYPPDRLAAIAAHAGLAAVVSAGRLLDQARSLLPDPLDLDALPPDAVRPARDGGADDIAAILYTSGTTGAPKGVFQSHRGMLHDVLQYVQAAGLTPSDRLTSLYSPSTVGAVRDIWAGLLTGAAVLMQRPRDGATRLAEFLREAAPTIWHSVPVLLRHLAAAAPAPFDTVRLGYVAGDRMDAGDVHAFFRLFPQAVLYTGLGATEASTIYVHRIIAGPHEVDGPGVPVGHAMPDRLALLLDEAGAPVPTGEIGEIFASSPYVARGYWRDPALTAERFDEDPDRPGWRRFRTGDLGRWRPDGLLEHHGRADHMVKLGGNRIELPAVEAALKAVPGVFEAAALLRPGPRPVLVAHVAATQGAAAGDGVLAALRRSLPAAMVPAALVWRDALPLLPNFKVDRAAVARDDAALAAAPGTAPRTDTGRAVAAAAMAALSLPALPGGGQDLLALGVDSMALVELAAALERRFNRLVPLEALLAARSPDSIAGWIDASAADAPAATAALVILRTGPADTPPLLWPHDVGGAWHKVAELMTRIPADRSWIGLRDPASYDPAGAADSVEAQAALMLAALVAHGLAPAIGAIPIGWSFAGRQAWELGTRLREAGFHVPAVIVIDAPPGPVGAGLEPGDPDAAWRAAAARRYAMAARYQAGRAPLDLILLRSRGHSPHLDGLPEDLGWSTLAARVTLHHVDGNHLTLWDDENLTGIAAVLADALAGVREGSKARALPWTRQDAERPGPDDFRQGGGQR